MRARVAAPKVEVVQAVAWQECLAAWRKSPKHVQYAVLGATAADVGFAKVSSDTQICLGEGHVSSCCAKLSQRVFGHLSSPSWPGAAGGGLEEVAGSAEKSPEHVRNALWTAHQLLLDVGSAKVDKRVLIFTCDPNPAGTGVTADANRRAPVPLASAALCATHALAASRPKRPRFGRAAIKQPVG